MDEQAFGALLQGLQAAGYGGDEESLACLLDEAHLATSERRLAPFWGGRFGNAAARRIAAIFQHARRRYMFVVDGGMQLDGLTLGSPSTAVRCAHLEFKASGVRLSFYRGSTFLDDAFVPWSAAAAFTS